MKPEVFFLKYAFPCAFIIMERKQIDYKTFNMLEDAAINSKKLDRVLLEKIFARAFEKIRIVSDEMNKDKWDLEVLREYFLNRHNGMIDDGMFAWQKAPESQKKLCRVQKAKIIESKQDCYIVEYGEGEYEQGIRPVLKDIVPNAKVGDIIMIHYGYAVEKL